MSLLGISNISRIEFKYGSLCDYSFYQRAGTPSDMYQELSDALLEDKVTPVSHTNIGGYKKQWFDMWMSFFDSEEISWVSVDEFMVADKILPMWQIPINENAPYTPEKIKPLIPYDEEENVLNPCSVEDLATSENLSVEAEYVGEKLVMYHNGTGPMCLEAVEFLETLDYPVEQHLDTEEDFFQNLDDLKGLYGGSEGKSTTFGYYPIIFIKDKAFSGFDNAVREEILALIEEG